MRKNLSLKFGFNVNSIQVQISAEHMSEALLRA